ncbi:type II toxin-antitoxin system VapC family toxin [Nitratireductor mangrovi]|uniref:Ribonuclease VapC n=1 Tax=Nitratireductor mangrovi TaxID=2599600 RepID=A0A5B8KUE2_9HYPH|nr:type II toxin-antitoxin system VapC family toxin [Nitratireductor mangrovi]QDY99235.1 type II toxin-antitoxin system VapC family toxin [Nitratireductor mangrovi]
MYVDASAQVAILKGETEREFFLDAIEQADQCITSPISVFEAAIALGTLTGSCVSALADALQFLERADVSIEPIDEEHLIDIAIARDTYGKGSSHPARLNLGDCISYAMAKRAGVPLLYKGNDFAHTDLG